MSNDFIPVDQQARDSIRSVLDRNLFVNAGAGSGKTTSMVNRICALVEQGTSIDCIVAITFTEKAAAELRNRIRKQLETLTSAESRKALEGLDSAPIGTIHSFAGRLLRENPIAAGVPPLLDIQDDLGSQIAFTQRWNRIRETLFEDPHARSALDFLIFHGVSLASIEKVARSIDQSWDRIDEGPDTTPAEFTPLDGEALVDLIEKYAKMWTLFPMQEEDKLVIRLQELENWCKSSRSLLEDIASGKEDPNRVYEIAGHIPPWPSTSMGNKNWGDHQAAVKQARLDTETRVETLVKEHTERAITVVVRVMTNLLLEAAKHRQLAGRLEFADLLILSRRMLFDSANSETWATIQERYPVLMVDEFQDTDPIQADIALILASQKHEAVSLTGKSSLKPGSLFTVGDPKQSIYRFRRADIQTFLQTQDHLDEEVLLTTNFRSDPQVLEWVNNTFADIIVKDGFIQPQFEPLAASNKHPLSESQHGPAVTLLGAESAPVPAPRARKAEAEDVAQVILTATGLEKEKSAWAHREDSTTVRPIKLSDICILIPTRTSLSALEDALSTHNIEYTAEASSLVYNDPEIQMLLTALQAVANTADAAALVTALRSPLFGCSDADLLAWASNRGSWNLLGRDIRDDSPFKAAREMAFLRGLVDALPTSSPADIIEKLVREKHFYEQQFEFTPRTREKLRRIRFINDQAQAWHEKTHGTLRDYLVWANLQAEDDARVKEPMIPESGRDAVRIMTIHAAKGLEFPMVIVSGSSGLPSTSAPNVLWDESADIQVRFRSTVKKGSSTYDRVGSRPIETSGFESANKTEKRFGLAEKIRLLYVACTRAESHLVVSLHRQERTENNNPSNAEILHSTINTFQLADRYATRTGSPWVDAPQAHIPSGTQLAESEWEEKHQAWAQRSAKPASFSITNLAKHPESAPITNPFDTPGAAQYRGNETKEKEYLRGRNRGGSKPTVQFLSEEEYADQRAQDATDAREHVIAEETERNLSGKHIGTAVHRTLELSNLSIECDLDAIARSVCAELGIAAWEHVASLSRNALGSTVVQQASTAEHWLELPMTLAHEGIVLEGVADLVFRNSDGELVVVDFKTDIRLAQEGLDSYWRQLSAYANLITSATGELVRSINLVMCSDSPAVDLTRSVVSDY